MKKYLITGASGFIGTHLISYLLRENNSKVYCIYKNNFKKTRSQANDRVIYLRGDILDYKLTRSTIIDINPSFIIHLAARKERTNNLSDFDQSILTNSIGALNVLKSSYELSSLQKVVLIGTADEYGDSKIPFKEDGITFPKSVYGLSKLTSTLIGLTFSEHFDLPVVILRPTIVFGPGQDDGMFISALLSKLLIGEKFKMTPGNQLRNFIYIDDLIHAIILSMNNDIKGEIINIGGLQSFRLKTIAKLVENLLGVENMVLIGAIPYRAGEIMNYNVDISKAKKLLEWVPKTSIEKGISNIIHYHSDFLKNQ